MKAGLIERLAARSERLATGCWEWRGKRDRYGYGKIYVDGRTRGAHRVMYELVRGPVPDGLQVDHLCRNRACVNPDHMETVTQLENGRRGVSPWAENTRKTHCPHGHAYDERNTYVRTDGGRGCRKCNTAANARYRAKRRSA